MKKALFVALIASIFVGCQSKEEKAEKLIKERLFKTLYDFSSYEPIETKIDSAFVSVYRDTTILAFAYLGIDYLEKANEYEKKFDDAIKMMEIWQDSYSSYGRSRYNDAKDDAYSNLEKYKDSYESYLISSELIKKHADSIPSEFCGWEVKHRFRCKTKGGQYDIADMVYVFDFEMKEIIHSEDSGDKELNKLKSFIDEALSKSKKESDD